MAPVHVLVISGTDYCSALYMGLPGWFWELWNTIMSLLHWLPICFHVKFKGLVLTYKGLNGLGPHFIAECLSLRSSTWTTWSSQAPLLWWSPQRRPIRSWAFSVVGAMLWNVLPLDVHQAPSFLFFRKQLQIVFFKEVFKNSHPLWLTHQVKIFLLLLSLGGVFFLGGGLCYFSCKQIFFFPIRKAANHNPAPHEALWPKRWFIQLPRSQVN